MLASCEARVFSKPAASSARSSSTCRSAAAPNQSRRSKRAQMVPARWRVRSAGESSSSASHASLKHFCSVVRRSLAGRRVSWFTPSLVIIRSATIHRKRNWFTRAICCARSRGSLPTSVASFSCSVHVRGMSRLGITIDAGPAWAARLSAPAIFWNWLPSTWSSRLSRLAMRSSEPAKSPKWFVTQYLTRLAIRSSTRRRSLAWSVGLRLASLRSRRA
mmetsp:Transcript_8133/g.34190  ORF Transcript_8133/g.34190 Transcript_8133/m.34190 type:complete len:218 (-) Transcript_8133:227-880(-)